MAGNLQNSSNYEALGEDPFTFKNCRPRLVSPQCRNSWGHIYLCSQSERKETASQPVAASSKAARGHSFAKLMTTFLCRVPAIKGV